MYVTWIEKASFSSILLLPMQREWPPTASPPPEDIWTCPDVEELNYLPGEGFFRLSCSKHPADGVPRSPAIQALSNRQIKSASQRIYGSTSRPVLPHAFLSPMCDHFAREKARIVVERVSLCCVMYACMYDVCNVRTFA